MKDAILTILAALIVYALGCSAIGLIGAVMDPGKSDCKTYTLGQVVFPVKASYCLFSSNVIEPEK